MKFEHPSLQYHSALVAGKWQMSSSKSLKNWEDLALAYTPGVAAVCQAIADHPDAAYDFTNKGHLVAVITNGTAVLGMGNIGPLAAKPVMEGKSALIKHFSGLNSIDLELDAPDPQKLIEYIVALAPSFGGINLEDIKAPECFVVEQALVERLNIPVFHDDQHGTAVVVCAAMLSGLKLKGVSVEDAILIVNGAGAGALACLNMLCQLGIKRENVFLCDRKGIVHTERTDLNFYKIQYARETLKRTLAEALEGADAFLGLSSGGVVTGEMIRGMKRRPLIFALANPVPEITPEKVYEEHPDALVSTGRSDYPNQINNLLCFPYMFRGALAVRSTRIIENMKQACVEELEKISREGEWGSCGIYKGEKHPFGAQYFIPKAFDPRLRERLPLAIAQAAIEGGVSKFSKESLTVLGRELVAEAYDCLPLFQALKLYQYDQKGTLPKVRLVFSYDLEAQNAWYVFRDALLALQSHGVCEVYVLHPEQSRHAQDSSISPLQFDALDEGQFYSFSHMHGVSGELKLEKGSCSLESKKLETSTALCLKGIRDSVIEHHVCRLVSGMSTLYQASCVLQELSEEKIQWDVPQKFVIPRAVYFKPRDKILYFSKNISVRDMIELGTLAMGCAYASTCNV